MNYFKELKAWQKAVDVAVDAYKLTSTFPEKEMFSLISQITRSAVTISSNIAEGSGRNTPKDFHHYQGIALGSCYELETQLIIANKVKHVSENELEVFTKNLQEIQRMIFSLQKTLLISKYKRPETKD